MSIGTFILLCWAWLPCFLIAKPCRLGNHRKKGDLLPVRATAGEVRYRAGGFVPPQQVLRRDPQAFDPEARHHEYLKVDPRLAEQHFQNREARDAYEATFGLGRRRQRTGERRKKSAASATQEVNSGVQKSATTVSRGGEKEQWEEVSLQVEEWQ